MPVSHFGIGEVIQKASAANLEARIKAAVLKQLPFVEQDGVRVVHQESSEIWTLDETKPWRYSEMTVLQGGSVGAISFQTAAPPVTQAVMHRALQGRPLSHSFLPSPECILDAAWEGGELRRAAAGGATRYTRGRHRGGIFGDPAGLGRV
jgi:hypothetical protein